jgi:HlyD family secretion protein
MADRRFLARTRIPRRLLVIGVIVVVVGGGAAVAWAATRSGGASYRTAIAGPATVTDSLAVTGTIQPVTQATVTFPMSGQVSSVSAKLGQQVTVGQTLARLNTTSLNNAVSSEQSAVATAQTKLASDQTSQTSVSATATAQTTTPSSSTGSPSGGTSSRSSTSSSPSGGSSSLSGLVKSLSGQQNAVRKAQQTVDRDLTLVSAAVHKVNVDGSACQNLLDALTSAGAKQAPSISTSATSTSGTSTSASPSASTTPAAPPPGGSTSVSDCETTINEALAAESKTDKDEHALTSAVAALSTALNKVVQAVDTSQQSTSHSSGTSGSNSNSSGANSSSSNSNGSNSTSRSGTGATGSSSGGTGSRSGSSLPASADQIAADQASVDAATAQLAAAQQNLAAATLVSPIAGTVADVTITEGQTASANSAAAQVVIIGPGQDEVTTAVADNQVGQVKPGEDAAVTPDGATKPITGKVTQIGALSTTTSSGAAGYPVTISLSATSQQLFDGATASVAITLGRSQAAVTVPTSAVRTIGGFSVVSKIVNGTPTTTRVTLGVQGPTVTEVASGLKVGDQVSLADMTAQMPTSGTTGTGRFAGGAGGLGGGGLGGAQTRTGRGGG